MERSVHKVLQEQSERPDPLALLDRLALREPRVPPEQLAHKAQQDRRARLDKPDVSLLLSRMTRVCSDVRLSGSLRVQHKELRALLALRVRKARRAPAPTPSTAQSARRAARNALSPFLLSQMRRARSSSGAWTLIWAK